MQIPFVRAGPVWYLNSSEIADLVIIEANTSHLAASDDAAFALSFVPPGAPDAGGFALAPAIAQTDSRTIACERSYFYQDFLGAA